MSGTDQDGAWESDCAVDYSVLNNRLNSFNTSRWNKQVPAEKMAQAGFFLTGSSDRVRCFSCQETVENWCRGDIPVERHREVSPSCTFLGCTHRNTSNSNRHTLPSYGPVDDIAAGNMEYQLRTGQVVDETVYPRMAHMKREEDRLKTFASWPHSAPVKPRELAQAGFFYSGVQDRVECFCCGGKLSGWEPGDKAWDEHDKHFPICFYILGHNVGNVPSYGNLEDGEINSSTSSQGGNPAAHMESFEERLGSFTDVQHPIDIERLARAGFYKRGGGDSVLCFRCGGGLKDWKPEEDPWEEHAKFYPGCNFLLSEKGQEYVNRIQLQGLHQNEGATPHQNGFSNESDDIDPLKELKKLQSEKRCKICMDKDACMVFQPCSHLVSCKECSESLSKCPICCAAITSTIRAFIA